MCKVENSEFEFLRLASKCRERRKGGDEEAETESRGSRKAESRNACDGKVETGDHSSVRVKITQCNDCMPREKTDSDLVSCSDSSNGKKRKRKKKEEDLIKNKPVNTVTNSGLSSSFLDSGVDMSFVGAYKPEKKHKKVKLEQTSAFGDPVNTSTPLSPPKQKSRISFSPKKHKSKRNLRVKHEVL